MVIIIVSKLFAIFCVAFWRKRLFSSTVRKVSRCCRMCMNTKNAI